jgi:hypothetical protein
VNELAGIAALGAFHGLNPAMGWLFAVGLGLQQDSRRALVRALGPIAAGHAAAVLLTVVAVEELSAVLRPETVRLVAGAALAAFAVRKLIRSRHPRWVGFRIGSLELAGWSFLMSSAHGAGLMLLPFLLGDGLAASGAWVPTGGGAVTAIAVHTAAMMLVAGGVALAVFDLLGVGVLRRAWINVDRLWATALLIAAGATLLG